MSAKLEKTQDEMGRVLYAPAMSGNKTGQQLPYFFDEVLALRVEKDAEGINLQTLLLLLVLLPPLLLQPQLVPHLPQEHLLEHLHLS